MLTTTVAIRVMLASEVPDWRRLYDDRYPAMRGIGINPEQSLMAFDEHDDFVGGVLFQWGGHEFLFVNDMVPYGPRSRRVMARLMAALAEWSHKRGVRFWQFETIDPHVVDLARARGGQIFGVRTALVMPVPRSR